MCLITTQTKPLIASEDMTVYKTLITSDQSCYFNFKYQDGKLYETTIEQSEEWCCADAKDHEQITDLTGDLFWNRNKPSYLKCFGQGFHSSTIPERLKYHIRELEKIVRCTIPAEAEYYLGVDNSLIISNKIIVHTNEVITLKKEKICA